jgi:hypothetical protein
LALTAVRAEEWESVRVVEDAVWAAEEEMGESVEE